MGQEIWVKTDVEQLVIHLAPVNLIDANGNMQTGVFSVRSGAKGELSIAVNYNSSEIAAIFTPSEFYLTQAQFDAYMKDKKAVLEIPS